MQLLSSGRPGAAPASPRLSSRIGPDSLRIAGAYCSHRPVSCSFVHVRKDLDFKRIILSFESRLVSGIISNPQHMIAQTKEQYISPKCEELEVNPEGVIASSIPPMPGEDY